jgi:pimeloyl-ACP methyl ester carboxylesterase
VPRAGAGRSVAGDCASQPLLGCRGGGAVWDQGQANLTTHLVLSPGLLCSKAHWAARLEALADIANLSIADHTRHDTRRDIARSILATAPEQIALAGLSMGGYIAYEVIRQAPVRTG